MKGMIKTYLPEKRYGFIKGDDGRDYFFHRNAFINSHDVNIREGDYIEFEQQATPKGYQANGCTFVKHTDINSYIVPDKFLVSKSNNIKGWNTVQYGHWIVYGTSRNSPKEAKLDAVRRAKQVGANGLINLEYFDTTGQERGTGSGTHYYTIHNFCGRIVNVANPHTNGNHIRSDLTCLNENAEKVKEQLVQKSKKSRQKSAIIWLILTVMILISLNPAPLLILFFLAIGYRWGLPTKFDNWLERP